MFYKTILTILLLWQTHAIACSVPATGEKYDELIDVVFDKKLERYTVTAPEIIEEGNGIFSSFTVIVLDSDGSTLFEIPMRSRIDNGLAIGELLYISEVLDEKLEVIIYVWWGMKDVICPYIGEVKIKHNKSFQPTADAVR
jgi:hypothetical protein